MDRMKTFGLYALCIILFYIFSNVMINVAIKCMYVPIDTYTMESNRVNIDTNKAKATYVNGYVGGVVKNIDENIEKAYIKIDLYSKRDVLLGTKYVEVNNLKENETREFYMGFRFTDVEYAKVKLVDQVEETVTEKTFISENLAGIRLIVAVIFLCYF